MQYSVRLNPKALNPLTKVIDASRIWEVEQKKSKDSDAVKWHCAEVRIIRQSGEKVSIRQLFQSPKKGEPPWSAEFHGVVYRGADDAIVIQEGRTEVE